LLTAFIVNKLIFGKISKNIFQGNLLFVTMNTAEKNQPSFNVLFVKGQIILQREYLIWEKNIIVVIENAKRNLLYYIVVIAILLMLNLQFYLQKVYLFVIFVKIICLLFNVQSALIFVLLLIII
jgi:hypothetical protein